VKHPLGVSTHYQKVVAQWEKLEEMDVGRHSAHFLIDEAFDLNIVFCSQN
jgi:hypothetical protein